MILKVLRVRHYSHEYSLLDRKRYAYLMLRDLWIRRGTPNSCFMICGSEELHSSYSLLLTSMCCDDAYLVTPRVSSLAGCDRLVSEPGYTEVEDPEEEPIEEKPLEEPKEEG
ncbi:hypothetical protein Tco_0654594 [Tanacetum coccineum]|uniref:Uncharacterized protein n=1 Tax=Tanacetum coccineum TaxID=301880 RepID=A0ABQ4X479_9ASTR